MKILIPAACLLLLVTACKGDPKTGAPAGSNTNTPQHNDGHGDKKPLGPLTVGTHTFDVVQMGNVEAGKEAMFNLDFAAGKPIPGTVRGWVGIESAQGSKKELMTKEGERTLHQHFEVPSPIPAGSKFWVEIDENGTVTKGSIAWK